MASLMPKAAIAFWNQGMFLFILGVSSFTLQIFTIFYSFRIQEWFVLQTLSLDSAVRSEAPLKKQFNNPNERGNRGNLNGLRDLFVTTPTFSYPVLTNILLSNTLFKRTSERHADQLQNKVSTNTKPEGKHFSVITLFVSSVVVAKGW